MTKSCRQKGCCDCAWGLLNGDATQCHMQVGASLSEVAGGYPLQTALQPYEAAGLQQLPRQGEQTNLALLEGLYHLVHRLPAPHPHAERSQSRMLGNGACSAGRLALDGSSGLGKVPGGCQVPQTPTCHGKGLAEAVDGQGALPHAWQRCEAVRLGWWVDDVFINLI